MKNINTPVRTVFLLLLFIAFSAGIQAQNAWINEIHYDDAGADANEFIEVIVEDAGSYNLADFSVILYNGSGGASYDTRLLSAYSVGTGSGNFSLYYFNYTAASSSIQNGSPDGVALAYLGSVISGQFLSYEGSFTATNGPANGMTSVDIGVAENGEPDGQSLQLAGTGSEYSDFTWQAPAAATMGVLNNSQTIAASALPEPSNYPTAFNATATGISISVSWSDATGAQVPGAYLLLISDADNIAAPIDGTPVSDDLDLSDGNGAVNVFYDEEAFMFLRLEGQTRYYLEIYPYTNTGIDINYKTSDTPPAADDLTQTILNVNDFEGNTFGTWTTYSAASNKNWSVSSSGGAYGTSYCANINGYQEDVPSNDWLISPSLNLDASTAEKMIFFTWWNFGSSDDELQLLYSTDYTGGDPTSVGVNWDTLPFYRPVSALAWDTSGFIDLSSISGTSVYIAFQYFSNGSPRSWNVDEIEITGNAVQDPQSFTATAVSTSQIDLGWALNGNGNNVLVAFSTDGVFGVPVNGTNYLVSSLLPDGGTVIYNGSGTSFNHTGRNPNTTYYYKAWSYDGSTIYSPGVEDEAITLATEPSNHPTGFTASSNGPTSITVSWNDSGADNYLIKASDISPESIVDPVDFFAEADGLLVKNVASGAGPAQFTDLDPETKFYFKIYPYNGSGESSNYKTDGTVPLDSATTDVLVLDLFISEIADPEDVANARFVELFNAGSSTVDFSNLTLYLCRQVNGQVGNYQSVKLTGSVAAGETYVVAYSSATFDTAFDITADLYAGLVNVNGDDGFFLYLNGDWQSGLLIDTYGVVDQDGTGTDWEYENCQVVRKRSISTPNVTWTASEWVIVPNVSYTNMTPRAHAEDVTWQGTSSTDWNERGSNWSGTYGYVPDGSYNVTVPVTANSPMVNEPSACNTLNTANGANLTIGAGGSLDVVGAD